MTSKQTKPQAQADDSEEKIIVKFLRPYGLWQTNEIAGFPVDKAIELCDHKPNVPPVAELYEGE